LPAHNSEKSGLVYSFIDYWPHARKGSQGTINDGHFIDSGDSDILALFAFSNPLK
jgi:hypothetical protein